MRANVIAAKRDESVEIFSDFLDEVGHTVTVLTVSELPRRSDVNFFLRTFDAKHLPLAPRNVGVFGPGEFRSAWAPYAAHFTQIWTDDLATAEVLQNFGATRVTVTGKLQDPEEQGRIAFAQARDNDAALRVRKGTLARQDTINANALFRATVRMLLRQLRQMGSGRFPTFSP